MSSGESGDESSGLDSPGPSGIGGGSGGSQMQHITHHNTREAYQNATVCGPRQPTMSIVGSPQPTQRQQQQQQLQLIQHQQQSQQSQSSHQHRNHHPQGQSSNEGINNRETSSGMSSTNSVIYPASALANIPQDVLLSLVQAGHLQIHLGEGEDDY